MATLSQSLVVQAFHRWFHGQSHHQAGRIALPDLTPGTGDRGPRPTSEGELGPHLVSAPRPLPKGPALQRYRGPPSQRPMIF